MFTRLLALPLVLGGAPHGVPTHFPATAQQAGDSFERLRVEVGEYSFDYLAAGPSDGELVILLHGFPQTGHAFRKQLRALAEFGYRAVAPDQRGYSAGARPVAVEAYGIRRVTDDVFGIADALGSARFHLVGHDWGGAVGWIAATRAPERILSLTVLATPHYAALGAGRRNRNSNQAQKSGYFADLAAAGAETKLLANNAAKLRGYFARGGIEESDIQVYVDVLSEPGAMRGALNWYRAMLAPSPLAGPGGGASVMVRVPTLYLWGARDGAFARGTAMATESYVEGPYTFKILEGAGHWLPEQAADVVNDLLLVHLEHYAR